MMSKFFSVPIGKTLSDGVLIIDADLVGVPR